MRMHEYQKKDVHSQRDSPSGHFYLSGSFLQNNNRVSCSVPLLVHKMSQERADRDPAVTALKKERSALRKQISAVQAEVAVEHKKCQQLEASLQILEEDAQRADAMRAKIQNVSASTLTQRINEQVQWNAAMQETLEAHQRALERKRKSHRWMREATSETLKQLTQFAEELTNAFAIHRSSNLSDCQTLAQLETRLGHRMYALQHSATLNHRHSEALMRCARSCSEHMQTVRKNARTKIGALRREGENMFRQFQKACELSGNQRHPSPRTRSTDIKPPPCLLASRDRLLFRGAPRTASPRSELSPRSAVAKRSDFGRYDDARLSLERSATGSSVPSGSRGVDAANDDQQQQQQSYHYHDPYRLVDAPPNDPATLRHAHGGALTSGSSTPRYSRGQTPVLSGVSTSTSTPAALLPAPSAPLARMMALSRAVVAPSQSPDATPPLVDATLPHDESAMSAMVLKQALRTTPPTLSRVPHATRPAQLRTSQGARGEGRDGVRRVAKTAFR